MLHILSKYQIYILQMLDLVYEYTTQKRCGCYVLNPQLLQLRPKERILVPLRTCEYSIEIVNAVINVTLVQTYHNPTDKFLELEYSFPISLNACVYRFVAEFGNIRIEGVVKEKEQAKNQYEQAVKMGKQAAYGELNAESKDILNLKVGNVSPKQQVKIEIVYLQQLSLSYNTFYQLHIPGTISPRYINYIPTKDIVKGYRKKEGIPTETEGAFTWSFKINLRTTRKVNFFDSHTHNIQMIQQNDTCTQSTFVLQEACITNKDFVFSYTTQDFELPNYVFGRTDVSSSAMLSFIPKFCSLSIDDAYKASVKGTVFESDIDSARGEYVFLLDRSGSMEGARIQKAKQALVLFIKSLPQDTYFNVVSFGSGSNSLFGSSVKYSNKQVDRAVNEVKQMSADMGGTEIYNPLQNLLSGKLIDNYPKQIFLLTDGAVSNTEGVIKMVGKSNKYSRVHTIGIGNGASEQLIIGCANKGKGHHVFINDSEDPSEKIIQLLTDSLSPVISKMKLSFDPKVVQSIIPNPQSLPYILKGEIVNFYITFKGQLDKKTSFTFSYQDSQNKLPYKSQIQIDPESSNESFIDRMGHFKRIRLLQDSHTNNSNIEDMMFYVKKVDKKAEIIEQSVLHQILSEFTAFICVEQELVDGKYQEVKSKGKVQMVIDNPPPRQRMEYNLDMMLFGGGSRGRGRGDRPITNMGSAPGAGIKTGAVPVMRSSGIPSRNQMSTMNSMYGMNQCSLKLTRPEDLDAGQDFFKRVAPRRQRMEDEMLFSNFSSSSVKSKKKKQSTQPKMEEECMERMQPCSVQSNKQPLINRLVAQQSTEGFWKDLNLIAELFDSAVEQTVKGEKDTLAVITYLIAKWIQRHYPQKQYSLIVKKALNYVKKEAGNFESYPSLYDKYVK